jgi:hypothetical protein
MTTTILITLILGVDIDHGLLSRMNSLYGTCGQYQRLGFNIDSVHVAVMTVASLNAF